MKFLKRLGITIVSIIFFVLVIALILPDNAKVAKSVTIKAEAAQIYAQVDDLKNWEKWSPFLESDPTMEITYEGPQNGVNAQMTWKSPDLGNGKLIITKTILNKSILTKISFDNDSEAEGEWQFMELGKDSVRVTWATHINKLGYPFGRIFGLFIEKQMSPFLNRGLKNLKRITEKLPELSPISINDAEGFHAVIIEDSALFENISTKFALDFNKLYKYITSMNIEPSARPFGIFVKITEKKIVFKAGLPVSKKINNMENIQYIYIPKNKYIQTTHFGSYNSVGQTYKRLNQEIDRQNLKITGPSMELYITDPLSTPDTNKWQTQILIPIK